MSKGKVHIIKRSLLIILAVALFIPLIQQYIKPFNEEPLDGAYEELESAKFSLNTWLSGEYQEQQERYLNEHFGFRPFFVRVYNQIQYSFFNYSNAKDVVIGKDFYLYEEPYILEALGRNYVGRDSIQKKVKQLAEVQKELKKLDKEIILLLAPGKGSFYPEYIPDRYQPEIKTTTNYEVYLEELQKTQVHILDFKQWFEEMKPISPYPLFPNAGVHWSTYSEALVADSLIHYIESLGYPSKSKFIISNEVLLSDKAIGRDNDIEQGMNLLFSIPSVELAYPSYSFEEVTPSADVPEILVMGDSYYWDLFENDILNQVFSSQSFWYYNYAIHSPSAPLRYRWDTTYKEEIEKCDLILIVITDSNLKDFAFEFIDGLHEAFVE